MTTAPDEISLAFSGEVLKLAAKIEVNGPDGKAAVGRAVVGDREVRWPVTEDLADGRYSVNWRVTSGDGHPIDGKFSFVVAAPPVPTGTPSPAPTYVATAAATPHTAEPGMTGPMDGMEGMPGMEPQATSPAAESSTATGLALAGLVLLTALVAGAIVIERRRRPPPGEDPSGRSNG